MAIIDARNYIATRLAANSLTEQQNPFVDQNIPATQLDRGFVTVIRSVNNSRLNSEDCEVTVTVSSDIFLCGYLDIYQAYQDAGALAQTLIKDILTQSNQVGHCITGVQFSTMEITPFENESNDNIIVLNIVVLIRTFINL